MYAALLVSSSDVMRNTLGGALPSYFGFTCPKLFGEDSNFNE